MSVIRSHTAAVIAGAAVVALGLSACSGSSSANLGTDGQIAPTGQRVAAPDLSGTAVSGGAVSLTAMKGHVVVLNVFGSWCPPCNVEQPGLTSLANSESAKGVKFLGLAELDDPNPLAAYLKKYAVPYPAIDDNSGGLVAKFSAVPVAAVPATLIIDKQGREAARFVTGAVTPSELMPVIASLNAEPA